MSRWSIASSPIGRNLSMISPVCSAASAMSAYSTTTSVRCSSAGVSSSTARSAVAQVLSVPHSARATLNPFSGSSSSRLNPDTRRGISATDGKPARIASAYRSRRSRSAA
ncbi:Uncharacterised protein [Mycobacterium tuberculosis]|nr:Uncharacterised protein [Mycobacterium tuberculosis]